MDVTKTSIWLPWPGKCPAKKQRLWDFMIGFQCTSSSRSAVLYLSLVIRYHNSWISFQIVLEDRIFLTIQRDMIYDNMTCTIDSIDVPSPPPKSYPPAFGSTRTTTTTTTTPHHHRGDIIAWLGGFWTQYALWMSKLGSLQDRWSTCVAIGTAPAAELHVCRFSNLTEVSSKHNPRISKGFCYSECAWM